MNPLLNLHIIVVAIQLFIWPLDVQARNGGFLYGTIQTVDGDLYEGHLRWGDEEAFWTDIFNASKPENPYIKFLTKEERDEIFGNKTRNVIKTSRWWQSYFVKIVYDNPFFTHRFSVQFGDLRSIRVIDDDVVIAKLKNGSEIELDGQGYNDIGTTVHIKDKQIGGIELDWDRIRLVTFSQAPSSAVVFGQPIFGRVFTDNGEYTGFIQWDHHERLSTDKLDGKSKDGSVSIDFGNIKSIKKLRDGCLVTLQSGREMRLGNTNDVDDGNRGIIITLPDLGRIDVPWDYFQKVDFVEALHGMEDYDSFKAPKKLVGSITTKEDEVFSGKIIYDLDEEYDIEVLEGERYDLEYTIPFRNIKRIERKTPKLTLVTLENDAVIELGQSRDVSIGHSGFLVGKNHDYLSWDDVYSITLDNTD